MLMGVSSRRKVVVLVAVLNIGPMHVIVDMLPFDHHRSVIGSGIAAACEHNGGNE